MSSPPASPAPGLAGLTELHLHLDGSLRPDTVEDLAARLGLAVPERLAFHPGMGLEEALTRFAFTLSLLQRPSEVRRVAAEIAADAFDDGVTQLELRFAPQLHRGAPLEAIVDAALEGLASVTSNGGLRAGLLLCGLYGEPVGVLEALVEVARTRPGVVGLDLAGAPSASQAVKLDEYAPPFRRARELGLGRTVHAGEGRSPREIRVAVEVLGAQRIGHGTTLLEDPLVAELVISRGIVVEACLTSNLHTGAIGALREHPLPRWLAAGVRACVCADNTLLSAVTTSQEHRVAAALPGMREGWVDALVQTARRASFRRT